MNELPVSPYLIIWLNIRFSFGHHWLLMVSCPCFLFFKFVQFTLYESSKVKLSLARGRKKLLIANYYQEDDQQRVSSQFCRFHFLCHIKPCSTKWMLVVAASSGKLIVWLMRDKWLLFRWLHWHLCRIFPLWLQIIWIALREEQLP